MTSEFERLLLLLLPVVQKILEEQERDVISEKPLDFCSFPSIHSNQKKGISND